MKPLKQCNKAGCRNLVPYNERFCEKHFINAKTENDLYENRKKIGGKYFKFYHGRKWKKLSKLYRLNNPICVHCERRNIIRKVDVVDHKIPIKSQEGWKKRYDENNLQSLCHSCHNTKTANDKKEKW
ncbi:HNH endonuclease [Vagococcus acidifermentans]|uniref:Putative HNH nuclease YajD n=1 Tax=Vagococcus acidifermentans TaxID=564710 RepID=A0A430AMS7_9ENTE|nr:HNH endonuclease [Vagococcus acidifermentans]RSU09376.1 hypothetical protein CBF27_12645 [Vagococcus acidifermentans]